MIKVGDYVKVPSSELKYTVIAVHHKDPDRCFVVAAYGGDQPKSFRDYQVSLWEDRSTQTIYVDNQSHSCNNVKWSFHTHKITFDTVNGLIDTPSVKMEKL